MQASDSRSDGSATLASLTRNVDVDTISPSEDSSRQKPMKLSGTQALVTLSGLVVVAVVLASAARQEGFC